MVRPPRSWLASVVTLEPNTVYTGLRRCGQRVPSVGSVGSIGVQRSLFRGDFGGSPGKLP